MEEQSETLRRALEALASLAGPPARKPQQAHIESNGHASTIDQIVNSSGWAEEFHRWALSRCVFRDRCFGGIGSLHCDWCEWQVSHNDVPASRVVFEGLLRDSGFLFADGLVYGLILGEDLWALEQRTK
jgi:hypothetical protein